MVCMVGQSPLEASQRRAIGDWLLEPPVSSCGLLKPTVSNCWLLEPPVSSCWLLEPTVSGCWLLEPSVSNCWLLEPTVSSCWLLAPTVSSCWYLEPPVSSCSNTQLGHLVPTVAYFRKHGFSSQPAEEIKLKQKTETIMGFVSKCFFLSSLQSKLKTHLFSSAYRIFVFFLLILPTHHQ